MEARINSANANQNQAQLAIRDSISLVLFDHEVFNLDTVYQYSINNYWKLLIFWRLQVIVPFENQDLRDPRELLNKMLQHQARNGTVTDFGLASQKAGFLISSYFDNTKWVLDFWVKIWQLFSITYNYIFLEQISLSS